MPRIDLRQGLPPERRTWRWWLSLPLWGLVRLYQVTLSPMLGPTCRFYPSCSAYSVLAFQRHGPVRGLWLTIRRVARCNPWNYGGVDHVPPRAGHHHEPDPGTIIPTPN